MCSLHSRNICEQHWFVSDSKGILVFAFIEKLVSHIWGPKPLVQKDFDRLTPQQGIHISLV